MTILVIDVGSSSVRSLQFGDDLTPIPGTIHRLDHRFTPEATADPVHLRGLIETCIDRALDGPTAASIRAVGMTTFVGNLLGVDLAGRPVTPLFTYADTRSGEDASRLAEAHDPADAHQRTGCRIHPAYHPAKLAWLRRTQPAVFAQVARWLDLATFCCEGWFGRAVPSSYSVASWSGLLHRETLTWDADWLDALGLMAGHLPSLADYDAAQRGLVDDYAQRWPRLHDAPFFLAVGDGAAANLGTGGSDAAHPVLTIGTTAAVRIVRAAPGPVPSGLWAYRVDAQRHLIGGATSEGGNIFAWAREVLRLDRADLDDALLRRQPGAHRLTALPLLAGERSPGYHANATGALAGLRLDTSPLDILHALLEGVALRLRIIYDLLGRPGDQVLAGGGALAQSAAWAQITADTLGVPLWLADVPEATARGVACLIAGTAAAPAPSEGRLVMPRQGAQAVVDELLAQHHQMYDLLYPSAG